MQYCVSRGKVIEYVTKYATKSEPRSLPLREVYANIVRSLKDDSSPLKAVQKLLINSMGERDYSAQPLANATTCTSDHHETWSSSAWMGPVRWRIILRLVAVRLCRLSPTIYYAQYPTIPMFEEMTLLHFAQNYI